MDTGTGTLNPFGTPRRGGVVFLSTGGFRHCGVFSIPSPALVVCGAAAAGALGRQGCQLLLAHGTEFTVCSAFVPCEEAFSPNVFVSEQCSEPAPLALLTWSRWDCFPEQMLVFSWWTSLFSESFPIQATPGQLGPGPVLM